MISAYKQHSQFILILIIMYVSGVWGGVIVYPMLPMFMLLFGVRKWYFELLVTSLWLLMLSDYVPVKDATYDDLQFAKDLKFLTPLFLSGFILANLDDFRPLPKLLIWFIPFFVVLFIALQYSIKINVGLEKTLSYLLMFFSIPAYVNMLSRRDGSEFWNAFVTFIIGMLTIGIVLRFVAPQIAMLEGGRFKSVLGNPNGLGIFLNLTFILWYTLRENKLIEFTRYENRFLLTVIILSLLWSGSRNGMMSILLFYTLSAVVRVHWFLAAIVVAAILIFNNQLFYTFIIGVEYLGLQDFFRIESIEEGSGRKIAWVFAWQEIQHYYFVGGGLGHDENIMRPNYYWLSRLGHQGGVHNSYLSMWFDAGIIGLLSYFIAFAAIIIRVAKENPISLAFGIAILFNITYESWLVASLNPFLILYLTILTIFFCNLKGKNATVSVEEETDEMQLKKTAYHHEPA